MASRARGKACFALGLWALAAALLLWPGAVRADFIAYEIPAGQGGNQEHGGGLGHDFNVGSSPIAISQLGVFDDLSDGLTRTLTAYLWDRTSPSVPLASLTFTSGSPGALIGGSRFKPLSTPLVLPAGFQGTISADGYGSGERNGNWWFGGSTPWTMNDGGGLISFVGTSRWDGGAGVFPNNLDTVYPNRYAAGTFQFGPTYTLTWDGTTSNWGAGAPYHWSSTPSGGPNFPNQDTTTAFINGGAATVEANYLARSLHVAENAPNNGQVVIGPGNTLTLAKEVNVAAGGALTLQSGSTLSAGSGTIDLLRTSGNATLSSGGALSVTNFTDQGIASTLTTKGSGGIALQNITVNPASSFNVAGGTLAVSSPGYLGGAGSLVLSGGTFDVTGPLSGTPAPANPIAYYRFDNASGTTVPNDGTLGASKNGTLFNGATITPAGKLGSGMAIVDGSDMRLDVPDVPLTSADWSIATWFNNLHGTDNWRTLARGRANDHQIIVENGTNRLGFYANGRGEFRPVTPQFDLLPNSGWHQIVAVGRGASNTTDFYIDGVLRGTADRSSTTQVSWIGNGDTGWHQTFADVIDEFRIYDRALTQADITNLYNYAGTGAIHMASTPITVIAKTTGSRINANSDVGATFGTLTFGFNSDLSVSGAPMTFAKIVTTGGLSSLGLSTPVLTTRFDDQGSGGVLRLYGAKSLTIQGDDSGSVNVKTVSLQVDQGATLALTGRTLLGGAAADTNVVLNGGTFSVTPSTLNPSYPNAYMAGTNVAVAASSTVKMNVAGTLALGRLTFSAPCTLTTSGPGSVDFLSTTLNAAGTTTFNARMRTVGGSLNAGGLAATVAVQGTSSLIFERPSNGLGSTTIQVQSGATLGLVGSDRASGAAIQLAGGSLVLGSPDGSNQTYVNPITSTANGSLVAGASGIGVASGDILVANLAPGAGTTVDLSAQGSHRLVLPNGVNTPTSSLSVSQGQVRATGQLTVGSLTLTGGTTTLTTGATLTNALTGAGTLITQGTFTIDPQQSLSLSGPLQVDSGHLTINLPALIPAGAQAYYTFDNGANPGRNVLGTGADATLNGGAAWGASGRSRGAMSFNGINGFLGAALDVSETSYGVSLWVRANSDNRGIFAVVDSDLGGGFDRTIYTTGGNAGARLWSEETITSSGLSLSDGNWHHIVHTFGGSVGAQELYVDGVLRATGTKANSDFTWQQRINIGFSQNGANRFFDGQIDEVAVYNRALTQADVTALYDSATPSSLGALKLAPGTQLTLAGLGRAQVASVGVTGGPSVSGPMTLNGAPNVPARSDLTASAAGDTLTLDAAVSAQNFNVAGAGTVVLHHDLTVAGGSLSVPQNATLAAQNSLAIDASSASLNMSQGNLNVRSGTLTVSMPPSAGGVPAGAVGYWPMDETSGLVVHDAVSGNNGSLLGTAGAQWQPGVIGNAIALNGVNNYVSVPDTSAFHLTGDMTIAFWYWKTAEANDWQRIVGRGADPNRNYGVWEWAGADQRLLFQQYNNGAAVLNMDSGVGVPTGSWNFAVASVEGTTGRIYINGSVVSTATRTGTPTVDNLPLTIGYGGVHTYFPGYLDEVLLYGRALQPSEIQNLYNAGIVGSYGAPSLGHLTLAAGTGLVLTGGGAASVESIAAGDGTSIQGQVTARGPITVGNSIGTLNVIGDFSSASSAVYHWETSGNGAGQSDLIAVSGTINLSAGATLKPYLLSNVPNGQYTLMTFGTSFVPGAVSMAPGNAYAELIDPAASSLGVAGNSLVLNLVKYPTVEWNSSGGTAWNVPGHWTPNTVPDATTAAVVNSPGKVATVAAAMGGQNAKTLIVDGGAALIEQGGALTVADNVHVLPGGQLTVLGTLTAAQFNTSGTTILGPNAFLMGFPALPPAGAVGYYSFENVSGATVVNEGSLGTAKNGTLNGAAAIVAAAAGRSGNVLSLPNATADMEIAQSSGTGIDLSGGVWTASAWYYNLAPQGAWRTLFRGSGGLGDHQVIVQDSSQLLGVYDNGSGVGGAGFRTATYDMALNGKTTGWHMMTAIGSGTTTALYVDGSFVGTSDRKSIGDLFAVGNIQQSQYPGNNQRFADQIDEVYVYPRTLSLQEIQSLYQIGLLGTERSMSAIHVTGGTTTGLGTTLGPQTTLRLAGGTLAGTFTSLNASTTPGSYAYEIESGTSNAVLRGDTASLHIPSTAGSPVINGPVYLNTMSVEGGTTRIADNDVLRLNTLNVSGGSLAVDRPAQVGTVSLTGGTMTTTRNMTVAKALGGAGTLIADGAQVLDLSSALVSFSGEIRVLSSSPANSGNLLIKVPAPGGMPSGAQVYYSFDESATPGRNVLGSGSDGVLNGGATWVPGGKSGGALSFNGSTSFVGAALDVSETAYAVSMWFKANSDNRGLFTVVQGDLGGANDRNLYTAGGQVGSRVWDNEIITTSGLKVSDGKWHHVVGTFGGTVGGQKLYVDGVLAASGIKAFSNFNWQDRINIGQTSDAGGGRFFDGLIDEVLVYNRALTSSDVTALYAAGVPTLGDLRLGAGSQATLGGAGSAVFNSIGAIGGVTVSSGLTLAGAYPHVKSDNAQSLTVDGTLTTQNFQITGPGTVTLRDNLTISPGGSLKIPSGVTLASQGNITIDASSASAASLNSDGVLNVATGTLTVKVPAATFLMGVFQNFDGPGTPYTLTQQAGAPGPAILNEGAPQNNVAQLLASTNGLSNNIAFDRTAVGAPNHIMASFKMKIGSGADGGAFALLSTANNGTSGAPLVTPGAWENPAIAGAFGLGFGIYDNVYWTRLDWNGAQVVANQAYDYRNKGWQQVNLDIQYVSGGANVSVDIAGNGVFSNYFIAGMTPYEGRVAFGGRTGGLNTDFRIDDINVRLGSGARLGNLNLAPGTQLVLSGPSGPGTAAFTSITSADGTSITGNVIVDQLLDPTGHLTIQGDLEVSDGATYKLDLGLDPMDLIEADTIHLDRSFTLQLFGAGATIRRDDKVQLFQYDAENGFWIGGQQWTAQGPPLDYLIRIANVDDPYFQYAWDASEAEIIVENNGIFLTGLTAELVPEPTSLTLLALGGLALFAKKRRRRRGRVSA